MIVRFLMFLALFWLLSKLLKAVTGGGSSQTPRPDWGAGARVDGGELVPDPQCGVYVPRETAVKGRDGTRFCSETCRDAYENGNA